MELEIYDLQGRLVKTLANGVFAAGEHMLTWYGRNDQDRVVASGLYLARMIADHYCQTHRHEPPRVLRRPRYVSPAISAGACCL